MRDGHVALPGNQRGPLPDAVRVGAVDPASPVEVTVTLRADRFARERDEVGRVLGQFGLSVVRAYPATGSLVVSGTGEQIEDAFHPELGMYDHGPDGILRGREGDVHLPASLEGIVTGVFGLDQRRVAGRLDRSRDSPPGQGKSPRQSKSPPAQSNPPPGQSPLRPEELEQRYSFPEGGAGGQTIAIAEFGGGYFPDDLRMFCQAHSRTVPQIEIVSVGSSPLTPDEIETLPSAQKPTALGESHEVMMDVEIVAGLCPEARISVFFAPFTQKGWIDLLDTLLAQESPPVTLCVSWGLAEDSSRWSPAAVDAINERLRAASVRGITVCAASGDDGCGDQMQDERAHVHFPASSPFVLAVGGTMLDGDAEVVWWNRPGDRSQREMYPRGGSTGGGVSALFARPEWQGVRVRSLNSGDFDGRVVPDVAGLAGLPGYSTVFQGQPRMNGGTSATAPLWAALVARIAAAAPENPLGFFTPLLYQAGADGRLRGASGFTDITEGSNLTPKPGFGYEADEGFDAVTGWGVPNGRALLASLRS